MSSNKPEQTATTRVIPPSRQNRGVLLLGAAIVLGGVFLPRAGAAQSLGAELLFAHCEPHFEQEVESIVHLELTDESITLPPGVTTVSCDPDGVRVKADFPGFRVQETLIPVQASEPGSARVLGLSVVEMWTSLEPDAPPAPVEPEPIVVPPQPPTPPRPPRFRKWDAQLWSGLRFGGAEPQALDARVRMLRRNRWGFAYGGELAFGLGNQTHDVGSVNLSEVHLAGTVEGLKRLRDFEVAVHGGAGAGFLSIQGVADDEAVKEGELSGFYADVFGGGSVAFAAQNLQASLMLRVGGRSRAFEARVLGKDELSVPNVYVLVALGVGYQF